MLKYILFLCSYLGIQESVFSQDFYNLKNVQEIKLYFKEFNWRDIMNDKALSDESYTLAQKVIVNGVTFEAVGAKFKGNSSFNFAYKKNPIHIELDFTKDQNYQGYKDIKLSNGVGDPSFIREALGFSILQNYTNAPRANFAKLWINDIYQGLYTNTEAVTKRFCNDHFSSSANNAFFKCTPPVFQPAENGSSLLYLGRDSGKYLSYYELKSNYGWKSLIDLCDTLNNHIQAVENILDVDHALWMLAFNSLFLNFDSYNGIFTQNYYLWRDDNAKFKSILWDLNLSFGVFPYIKDANGLILRDSLSQSKASLFLGLNEVNKPLISKLLSNARFSKMYIAHIRTMVNEILRTNAYRIQAEAMHDKIDNIILSDANTFYQFSDYKKNLYHSIKYKSGGLDEIMIFGVVGIMQMRLKYLDTLQIMQQVPPRIENLSQNNVYLNDTAWINARVGNFMQNGVMLGYRNMSTHSFTRVPMFDDGRHHDGLAQDGIFGYGLVLKNQLLQYYFWAENENAGIFSPERAEHEYHTIVSKIPQSSIVINELMASNSSSIQDPFGEYDDWIELYNPTSTTVDLSDWHITDNSANLTKWKIPNGNLLAPNSYLIIWADEDSSQNTKTSLHANFKLSTTGERLILINNNKAIEDEITFPAQKTNVAYARSPNGFGLFAFQEATFSQNNNSETTVQNQEPLKMEIYPNPTSFGEFNIKIKSNGLKHLEIFNALGEQVYKGEFLSEIRIETSSWIPGIYFIKCDQMSGSILLN